MSSIKPSAFSYLRFVQTRHGIFHNKIEDTKEEHLALAVTTFDKLADKAFGWIESRNGGIAR